MKFFYTLALLLPITVYASLPEADDTFDASKGEQKGLTRSESNEMREWTGCMKGLTNNLAVGNDAPVVTCRMWTCLEHSANKHNRGGLYIKAATIVRPVCMALQASISQTKKVRSPFP